MYIRFIGIATTTAVTLVTACVSSAPKHPAPVVAPIPEPAQVTKVFPIEQPPEFIGEELRGSVLPDTTRSRGLLGIALNGTPVYLSDYRGKVVVVSYWASWSPSCWTDLPQLDNIRAEYHGRDVEIIAINVGEVRSTIDNFLQQQQKPLRVTIVSDRSEQVPATQGTNAVPTTIVFDPEGKVSKRYSGESGFNAQRIRSDINRLLSYRG